MSKCHRIFPNLFCFFVVFICLMQIEGHALTINIVSKKNGVGLSQDIDILENELKKLGHHITFMDENCFVPYPKVDINIFVQPSYSYYLSFLPFAEKNYLMPNHEWCFLSPKEIALFDVVLCKTKETERVFKPLNDNTVFIGFTGQDCYEENISKNYKMPLHVAGASIQKGTNRLIKTWLDNPQFPSLTVIQHRNKVFDPLASNINFVFDYLPTDKLRFYQNSFSMHLCPSETEGFGHYIIEGLSSGAVVITTDAPPMNEFVADKRCLVGYDCTAPLNLATNYYVDSTKLEMTVAHLLSLPEEELKKIGEKNREFYLENDRLFKERLAEVFSVDFKLIPKQKTRIN